VSLIEAAINKAKELAASNQAEAGAVTADRTLKQPRRSPPAPRHRVPVATPLHQARTFKPAATDPAIMEQHGILLQLRDETAERSYKILRTRVQQRMEETSFHSMAITAAGAGDGKTLTAINMAIAMARDVNTWVFLVDLDMQRPKVSTYLGLQYEKGLSDYLAGTATFDEIVYEPGVERLAVIPNGRPLEQSSELLASPRMSELIRSLAAEVPRRVVIFDMPPLLLSDDVLRFLPNVDGLLLVVSEARTQRAALAHARELLPEDKLLGVVLNRSHEREESGYY
jgi:capsular exopolysaccharide synthesis family protein